MLSVLYLFLADQSINTHVMPAAQSLPVTRGGSCTGGNRQVSDCAPGGGKHAQQAADQRILRQHDQQTGTKLNVSQLPRANWLSRLATVFPAGGTLHKPTEAARSYLLAETIGNRYPSLENFVLDFEDFVKNGAINDDTQAQYFLDVVFSAASKGMWDPVSEHVVERFARIVISVDDSFYSLMAKTCASHSTILLSVLESCLRLAGSSINNNEAELVCEDQAKHLVNRPLIFGETPLTFALRHKCPEVAQVLLRWGANVNDSWMNFRNPLEALLFSPNHILVTEQQEQNILKCATYLCSVLPIVDLVSLRSLEKEGYCALLTDWEEALVEAQSQGVGWGIHAVDRSTPSTLSHHCRLVIRKSLLSSGSLPGGAYDLPLPKLLQQYIDLRVF